MFKRNALKYLDTWLKSKNRKPLVIRGARQVGKSTLVRLFCEEKKLQLIEVNLEITKLNKIDDTGEIDAVLEEIEIRLKKTFNKKTLLFFDEIQVNPKVLPLLRYFYEKRPDIPVIAAGSLLEFVLESHVFSMPVGRIEYLHLGPLTFFEFLEAVGEGRMVAALRSNPIKAINNYFKILEEKLRYFFFIGGMPEAVLGYVQTKSILEVRKVHRSIVQTYRDDFPKYANKKNIEKISTLFDSLPHFIGKKVRYSEILPEERSTNVKETLRLFKNARLLNFAHHTNATALPLRGLIDEKTYKMFYLDIGLLLYLLGIPDEFVLTDLRTHPLVEGIIAEQFIAQHLAYFDEGLEAPELFYWMKDKKSESAELDFLFGLYGKIVPVEIKSGSSGKIKSLLSFMLGHPKIKQAFRFDLKQREENEIYEDVSYKLSQENKVKKVEFQLINVPLFAVELIASLIDRSKK